MGRGRIEAMRGGEWPRRGSRIAGQRKVAVRLVVAIVQDYDANPFLRVLAEAGFRATLLRTTGGFLRQGNTTVLVAVEDGATTRVTDLCRQTCGRRTAVPPDAGGSTVDADPTEVVEVRIGGGVIFVIRLDRMVKLGPGGRSPGSVGIVPDALINPG